MRKILSVAAVIGAMTIGVFALETGAGAASYPGGVGTQTSPTVTIGAVFYTSFCGYAPGSTISETINGATVATGKADADGCITFIVSVGHGPSISIAGGGSAPATFGPNSVGAVGGNQTSTDNFTLVEVNGQTSSYVFPNATHGTNAMAIVISSFALVALGFLILTFSRRRRPAESTTE